VAEVRRNFTNFLLNQNCKLDLGIFYFLAAAFFLLYPPQISITASIKLQGYEQSFSSLSSRFNPTNADTPKEKGKYQETF